MEKLTKYFIPLLLLVVMGVTNPSLDDHQSEVKRVVMAEVTKQAQSEIQNSDDEWGKAGTALGYALGQSFINSFVDNMITRDNYIIFSLTRATIGDNEKVIGFGVFGNVWITEEVNQSKNRIKFND